MSKIWRFYKKPTEEMKKFTNQELRLDVKYPLYAVTADKKMANMFRKTRNMDLFLEKSSSIDKDDVGMYLRAHDHATIDIYELDTYKDKNLPTQEPMVAKVCMTKSEYDYVADASDTGSILNLVSDWAGWVPIELFTPKIKKLLYKLGYHKAQLFVYQGEIPFYLDMQGDATGISFYDLEYEFDQFGVFVVLYEHTFSKDFSANVVMDRLIK